MRKNNSTHLLDVSLVKAVIDDMMCAKLIGLISFHVQGKCPTPQDIVTKSLDNIVGNLWQQRQESSGSSAGNQVRT